MTREEKENRQKEIMDAAESEYFITKAEEFAWIHGAEWADQHPRKGLVDIEKACTYLESVFQQLASYYSGVEYTGAFCKAMED